MLQAMAYGLQIFGPNGATWLDTTRKTTRQMGAVTITAGGGTTTVSVPKTGSATIWAFTYGSNGGIAILGINEANSTVTYGPGRDPWPAGAVAYVFWGTA